MMSAERGAAAELLASLSAQMVEDLRIGIVRARFNDAITLAMLDICTQTLQELGVQQDRIVDVTVPGALEIPIVLDGLAQTQEFKALIAIGCVIRGATYHFELVAQQSAADLSRVALLHKLPVMNAILTVENEAQALERIAAKSRDAALGAVEMALTMSRLMVLQIEASKRLGTEEDFE